MQLLKVVNFIRKLIFTTLVCIAFNAKADILSVHCPVGCPSSPAGDDLVFSHVYALSNNPSTKFADWVSYEVDIVNFGVSPCRNWASDPLLDDAETLEKKDYKKVNSTLNIDRGHQSSAISLFYRFTLLV